MKKLRIALFFSSDPSTAGGVQEHIIFLSRELSKRGHTVDIFGPQTKKRRYNRYHEIGTIVDMPIPNGNQANIHLLNSDITIAELISKKKFDLLHIHEPYAPFAAWNLIDQCSLPMVATFHTAWDNKSIVNILNNLIPFFKEKFSAKMKGAVYVSHITRNRWRHLCDKTVIQAVIPNAVDTSLFVPKNTINTIPQLLFTARIVHRKGILQLLEAMKIVKQKGYRCMLTVIGDGKERQSMLSYIKKSDLSSHVTWKGEITGASRYEYFTNADIFCAPYKDEAAPIAILEAISAGLPIVGFKNESFKESLKNYPGRELIVSHNVQLLANAIMKLLDNKAYIQQLKEWCLAERKMFSWESVAQETEQLYYQAIEKYALTKKGI